ncbi:ribonuclease H-like domain-containing protein, partial [Tanacetum coccineum]
MLENQENNKSKSDKGYHAVPPPYTWNFMPCKPDLTFMDEIVEIEPKTVRNNSFRPPVIEDWKSDDESEVEIIPKVKIVSSSTEKIKLVNFEHLHYEWYKKVIRTSVEEQLRYEDYDGGFVSFGDGKGRISGKVPRKDNIYSVDLESVVPTKGLTCLFAKATIDESNLWHRRLRHINFKNMNKLVRGNLVRVDFLRCDNGTEFKNSVMNQFCEMKGIKREFSVARTPQQNGVARTMLVNSKLPTIFWTEAVNTACYVLNRVLIIKPHNKTPYELIRGRPSLIDFMKPFGCPVTILNTRDHLGMFDGKADEGFFVGYFVVSKAMRVFNKRTRIVEETLNIRFLENTSNVTGNRLDWLFDVDSLSKSMNYVPVIGGNKTNSIAGKRDNIVAGQVEKKTEPEQEYILIPICITDPLISQDPKVSEED